MRQPDWYDDGIRHIWLPYAQMQTMPAPLPVVAAQGSLLTLADGRTLVDGVASWWSACHGYQHPHLIAEVEKQLHRLPHVMLGGLVHEPALTLASKLCALTGMERVFFADSGSVAVEVALKMALQYWRNQGKGQKDRFICFRDGYHGDTQGAMGVSDPESLHKAFRNSVIKQFVLDIPSDEYGFAEFDTLLEGIHASVAGLIIEPLVQGAGGMRFHSADVLAEIYRIAKKHHLLFIADEIATGFGRTGNLFACEEAGILPDILCLGKGLTGGIMTLAATVTQKHVFDSFLSESYDAAFMHGPTFMGNPLACSAALASLALFEQEDRLAQVESIEQQLLQELSPCEGLKGVVDVRVKGAIGVVQIEPERMDIHGLRQQFIERGVWIRPFQDILYVTPALTISQTELNRLTHALCDVAKGL